jgi:hypothetical protein
MALNRKSHIITTAAFVAVVLILLFKPVTVLVGVMALLVFVACYILYNLIYDFVNDYINRDPNDDGFTDEPGP